jgi:hypothetical protein
MTPGSEGEARPRKRAAAPAATPRAAKARSPRGDAPPTAPRRGVPAPQAIRRAAQQLAELLGRVPESVSALKPAEDGWQADVEVLELERIPDTTSILATYRVSLDAHGDLVAYERIHRYTRGQIDRRT